MKDVQKILWAQAKLVNKDALAKQIFRKPAKIASLMFDVLPKADVVAMATQLCKHCAVDCVEEVLEKYRRQSAQILAQRLDDSLKKIKELDALAKDDEPNEDGPNDDEPNEDGPNDDEPNEDGPNDDEPNEDGPKEAEPMKTPLNSSHWIKSNNTTSGFKGVNKCRNRAGKAWRAKCGGITIGRYETQAEACQAYYDYCKANGKLKKAKKKKV